MIAVIFEVIPNEGQKDEYFRIAETSRATLEKMDGFISIERFQSFHDPGKVLSLSFWKDEESIRQWRNVGMHRWTKSEGRESIFKDYLLRIGVVSRDYGMFDREEDLKIVKSFMTNKNVYGVRFGEIHYFEK